MSHSTIISFQTSLVIALHLGTCLSSGLPATEPDIPEELAKSSGIPDTTTPIIRPVAPGLDPPYPTGYFGFRVYENGYQASGYYGPYLGYYNPVPYGYYMPIVAWK